MTALIEARQLSRYYKVRRGPFTRAATLRALDSVSFTLEAGRTLAVVGESGCGKSTLARQVTMIEFPTSGQLLVDGRDVRTLSHSEVAPLRRRIQIVFQDPFGSLNPRKKVGTIIGEPLAVNSVDSRAERQRKVRDMMERVGLRPEHYDRYPHMFSGGQRQRIAIARALMLNPPVLVADEPVSALDVSIQAQVLNLMMDLQQELGLAYLFVSHDLSVVRHIADEIIVMYLGQAMEWGDANRIFAEPRHPYTRALMAATPHVDPALRARRELLAGELPSPMAPPSGCPFHTRCRHATDICKQQRPAQSQIHGRSVTCHHAGSI